MRKRILAILLAVSVLGSSTIPAMELHAEELSDVTTSDTVSTPVVKDGITYTYNTETESYKVTKIADDVLEAVVLAEIDGKAVTEIDGYVSWRNQNCSKIVIPASVTSINQNAFYSFGNLENITVAEGNTVYSSLDGILYSKDRSVLMKVPEAFKVDTLNIPSTVTKISEWACVGCKNIKKINILASVTEIGNDKNFGIEEDIGAFFYCTSLTEFVVDEANPNYCAENGILYNKNQTILFSCPGGMSGTVEIPESVVDIADRAFLGCEKITNVKLPSGIKNIGYKTFLGCKGLKEIVIPEGVTYIEDDAFQGNTSLEKVTLPNSLEYIGFWSFTGSGLKNVKIPEKVSMIETGAFSCPNLLNIIILNKDCIIDNYSNSDADADTISRTATIHGYEGSTAQEYAERFNRTFKVYDGTHSYTSEITKAPTCTTAGETAYICTECGDTYTEEIPATGHTIVTDKAIPATCTTEGKTEGSHCSVCNTVITAQQTVPVTAHKYTTAVTKATTKSDGSITKKCTVCGAVESTTAIPYPKTIELSRATYTYNGKTQKPSVTVRDSQGKALAEGTDYSVIYSGNCKDVGKYTVTINFTGNYSGSVEKTFTITPKSTSLTKVKAAKKGFTAKWKKQSSQTTGYQIQYSTSKKFAKKATKAVNISKNKTTSKSISKLKAKKKYYVRVRTYKTVKIDGKNTKIYSDWSKVKSVTTKK